MSYSSSIFSKEAIEGAHERIQTFIHKTPVLSSSAINQIAGCEIHFKCENFQKIGAFKMRGATNAIQQLSEQEKEKGVVTHSSGNHAQAVALAAKKVGCKAYIVMPSNAPKVKIAAVKDYGGEVILCEPTLKAREEGTQKVIESKGALFIHPYDNQKIILGQATAAKELIEHIPDLNALLTPVGGGGLLAGSSLSAKYFASDIDVYGCEPEGADDAYLSFTAKQLVPQTNPNTIADGLLTSLGKLNFQIIQQEVLSILLVNDKEIKEAMKLIWERMKIIIEPSCAVPLAAVLKNKELFKGQKIGIILSGGNIDVERFISSL